MASSSPSKVSLKLLIDTNSKRVLFAEASKEFIDFLFNLLRLPLGTVTRLLTKKGMVGCLGKLYESIENLGDVYLNNPVQDKDILLKPMAPTVSGYLLPVNVDPTNPGSLNLYMCSNRCNSAVTYVINTACPNCRGAMRYDVKIVGNNPNATKVNGGDGGFVKGVVTYTLTDDLEVLPMSSISTIALISKFKVKDIACLQEKVVQLGMEEGIKLLKASLQCNNVLTSVFLNDMAA